MLRNPRVIGSGKLRRFIVIVSIDSNGPGTAMLGGQISQIKLRWKSGQKC